MLDMELLRHTKRSTSVCTCPDIRDETYRYSSNFASEASTSFPDSCNFKPPFFIKVLSLLLDTIWFSGVRGETYDGVFRDWDSWTNSFTPWLIKGSILLIAALCIVWYLLFGTLLFASGSRDRDLVYRCKRLGWLWGFWSSRTEALNVEELFKIDDSRRVRLKASFLEDHWFHSQELVSW